MTTPALLRPSESDDLGNTVPMARKIAFLVVPFSEGAAGNPAIARRLRTQACGMATA
jgi:hypothetical protein